MKKLYTSFLLLLSIVSFAQDPAETFSNPNLDGFNPNSFSYIKAATFPKITVFPDGKFAVYSGTNILRVDGNLVDLTFNAPLVGEYVGYKCQLQQLLALPDGKLMVLTTSGGVEGYTDKRLVRLNQDGSIDLTFNPNFPNSQINYKHLALHTDGKLLVAYQDVNSAKIVRLNLDGSLDTTFTFPSNVDIYSKFIVLPNGKIVFDSYDQEAGIRNIRQINSNGTLDSNYAAGTGFSLNIFQSSTGSFIALPDNKVLVGSLFSSYNGIPVLNLMKLNTNGTVDTSFNFNVVSENVPTPQVNDLALDANGNVVIAFNSYVVQGSFEINYGSVVRINANGAIDNSFLPQLTGKPSNVTILPNQDIIVQSQSVEAPGDIHLFDGLIKFNPTGSHDNMFNNAAGFSGAVSSFAIQQNNKIIIGGSFQYYNGVAKRYLARLNSNGSVDESFVPEIIIVSPVGRITLQPDGKVIMTGLFKKTAEGPNLRLIRLNIDGTLDESFSPPVPSSGGIGVVTVLPSGKILVGGYFFFQHQGRSYSSMMRLNSNGSIDTSFFDQTDNSVGFNSSVAAITLQPDGKILVGGSFTGFALCGSCVGMNRLVRLNEDGTRDSTLFNYGLNDTVNAIALEENGNILVGGDFVYDTFSIAPKRHFIRFSPIGLKVGDLAGGLDKIKSIAVQPDGKILVSDYTFKRYNQDLTIDASFYPGKGFNGKISQVSLRSDGKIAVAGEFTSYMSQSTRRFTILNGNDFYEMRGVNRFDADNNGCNASDIPAPYVKINLSNGNSYLPNSSGNYKFGLPVGSYTVTPTVENPTYYTISPASVQVNFPTQAAPLDQDFCITANGTHHDLEISILPLAEASPGFNATYRILYKNIGTAIESGTVNFSYNNSIAQVVSSVPSVTSTNGNTMTWNFSGLQPFESKFIDVTLKFNTPQQSPALIGGENIMFSANLTTLNSDETPANNTFELSQTVVNSFDPNDKTCLQGNSVDISTVGDYVTYLIRFENIGNGNAKNIFIRDEIDSAKFDITTLTPLHASHLFSTKVYDGNRVQFLFENILLPSTLGSNTGYVAFKIKTVSTLNIGDSFSNAAAIYFDYNDPILTNNEVTTIADQLSNPTFEQKHIEIKLYPNPVVDQLHIKLDSDLEKINSVEIYNISGQLLMVLTKGAKTASIDVSHLPSGTYLLKLNSGANSSTHKFFKK